ncbi:MAG: PHP domain-containing protein [Candidatus Pacebacteria bacterium]|nr:PHP domain-containing protein [Candidatus Paceibacterota bacterium]
MKIDLHCHTFSSYDATSSINSMIEQGKKNGIDGIAITDHENANAWKEAISEGQKAGFEIILGEEIKSSKGDILGLFMQHQIDGKGKDPEWIISEIRKQGGLVFIPHPFHEAEGFKDSLEKYVGLIDGVEIFNGRRPFHRGDAIAEKFADKHDLIKIGGSDSHYHRTIGNTYTQCNADDLEGFKKELLAKRTIVRGKKAPIIYFCFPIMKKLGLIRKPI